MTLFLITVSFLLHGVTLFIIVMLAKRVSKANELELQQQQVAKEIEDTFTAYLLEIKEENERLLNRIEENGYNDYRVNASTGPKEHGVHQTVPENEYASNSAKEDSSTHLKQQHYTPPQAKEEEIYTPSLQSSIYQLHLQGLTNEEIAKQLDCGKTEVELTLKINGKNV
ncbi:hypothetical protein [Pontibacillus litoralis]|uniref:Swarming motility protein SwrB n=1 Tax=Pontibacillus litoralis JSM 072002 TaxID=1385512 RepID=A0A0A5G8N4_9BACI|nr:hypothetical protein [Pontibacillus litoralis]KGX88419.1 hypothetical protein N784_07070 [Pontibacillus litoralis JSM 072002]